MFGLKRKQLKQPGVMGIYSRLDDALNAVRAATEKKFTVGTVYSPTPRHEIREALGLEELSSVKLFTLFGGLIGIVFGIGLTVYTTMQWKFIVSGKPPIPIVPTVIVAFEFCILFAILFNLAGMLIKNRLPSLRLPEYYDPRWTEDRFGVVVLCSDADREQVSGILRESGAEEVHEIRG